MSRATTIFGSNVFDDRVMEAALPTGSYHALRKAMKERAVEAYNKEIPRPALTGKSIICNALLIKLADIISRIAALTEDLEYIIKQIEQIEDLLEKAAAADDSLCDQMGKLRMANDEAECVSAKQYWLFPTYADRLLGICLIDKKERGRSI